MSDAPPDAGPSGWVAEAYRISVLAMTPEARAMLADAGITPAVEVAFRLANDGQFVGSSCGVRLWDGTWQEAEDGKPVFTVAETRNGEIGDQIAFDLSRPHMPASMTGGTAVLGAYSVEEALFKDGVAEIHADVLTWIRAGGSGGVIVDWKRPPWILATARIIVDSVKLGDRIAAAFPRGCGGPAEILVRQPPKPGPRTPMRQVAA